MEMTITDVIVSEMCRLRGQEVRVRGRPHNLPPSLSLEGGREGKRGGEGGKGGPRLVDLTERRERRCGTLARLLSADMSSPTVSLLSWGAGLPSVPLPPESPLWANVALR